MTDDPVIDLRPTVMVATRANTSYVRRGPDQVVPDVRRCRDATAAVGNANTVVAGG
jgi:hypothetical protein